MDPALAGFLGKLAEKLDKVEGELAKAGGPRRFRPPSVGPSGGGAGGSNAHASPTPANDDVMAELRAVRQLLAAGATPAPAAPAASPAPPPSSPPPPASAASPAATSSAADALRRELRRVSDAYAALVRDARAQKGVSAAREAALQAEVARLSAAAGSSDRQARAASELSASLRATRAAAEAAQAEADDLRARLADAHKSEARARAAAADARGKADALSSERDALLDYIADAKAAAAALTRERDDAVARAAAGDVASASLAAAQALSAARADRVAALEAQLAALPSLREVDQLRAANDALSASVAQQAEQLRSAQGSAHDAAGEAGRLSLERDRLAARVGRLEAVVAGYRSAEAALLAAASKDPTLSAPLAGLGWGLLSLGGAQWDSAAGDGGGSGHTSARRRPTPASTAAAAADAPPFEPPLARFLSALRAGLSAASEQEGDARVAAAEDEWRARLEQERSVTAGVAAERDAARAEAARLASWKAAVDAVEDDVRALLQGGGPQQPHTADSGHSLQLPPPTTASAPVPSSTASPLTLLDWQLLPSFTAALPALSAAVARLRDDAAAAHRQRRVAEAEAADLRQELALLRVEAGAEAAGRDAAVGDVRSALRATKADRDRVAGELAAARGAADDLRAHASAGKRPACGAPAT
jgi:hypothetical protein